MREDEVGGVGKKEKSIQDVFKQCQQFALFIAINGDLELTIQGRDGESCLFVMGWLGERQISLASRYPLSSIQGIGVKPTF